MEIDFTNIINIVTDMSKIAVPLGVIFGIGDLIISTMFKWIFGYKRG